MERLIGIFFLLVTSVAVAAPITITSHDYYLDNATGLRWLNVNLTRGKSSTEVSAALAGENDQVAGDGFAIAVRGTDDTLNISGWRYATVEEYNQLVASFLFGESIEVCEPGAVVSNGFCHAGEIQSGAFNDLISSVGDTGRAAFGTGRFANEGDGYTFGLLSAGDVDSDGISDFYLGQLVEGLRDDAGMDLADRVVSAAIRNDGSPLWNSFPGGGGVGSFLVASPVPLPAGAWLFLSALATLIFRKKLAV